MSNSSAADNPQIALYFTVSVDAVDLGVFTEVSGLGMNFGTEQKEQGGSIMFTSQLTGRVTYPNLELTRPVGPHSETLMNWLNSITPAFNPATAEVQGLAPDGSVLMKWQLYGVVPVSWTGPTWDAANPAIATEKLELGYQGFL